MCFQSAIGLTFKVSAACPSSEVPWADGLDESTG